MSFIVEMLPLFTAFSAFSLRRSIGRCIIISPHGLREGGIYRSVDEADQKIFFSYGEERLEAVFTRFRI